MYYVTEMGFYIDTRILSQLRRSGNHLFILGGKKLFIIIGNVKYIFFIIIFLIIHCNISSFYSCGQQSTSVFFTSAMRLVIFWMYIKAKSYNKGSEQSTKVNCLLRVIATKVGPIYGLQRKTNIRALLMICAKNIFMIPTLFP